MTLAATSSTKDSLSVEKRLCDTILGYYMSDPSSRAVRFLIWISLSGIAFAALASLQWSNVAALIAMRWLY